MGRLLVEDKNFIHPYPHCWRSDTPLIYKAISVWFIKVTEIKDSNKIIYSFFEQF
jgi:isoleucyl-tRNA synthetase